MTTNIRSVSFSTALDHVRHVEILTTELDRLYRTDPSDRAAIGYAQQHLGIELKLASVQAALAQVEAIDRLVEVIAGDDLPEGMIERSLAAVRTIVPAGAPTADDVDRCATCDSPAVDVLIDGVPYCRLHRHDR